MIERTHDNIRVTCRKTFNGMVYEAWEGETKLDMTEDMQYRVGQVFPVAEQAIVFNDHLLLPLTRTRGIN